MGWAHVFKKIMGSWMGSLDGIMVSKYDGIIGWALGMGPKMGSQDIIKNIGRPINNTRQITPFSNGIVVKSATRVTIYRWNKNIKFTISCVMTMHITQFYNVKIHILWTLHVAVHYYCTHYHYFSAQEILPKISAQLKLMKALKCIYMKIADITTENIKSIHQYSSAKQSPRKANPKNCVQ